MNDELYIQVKRYYRREMPPEERANWEAKIASDATFSTEVIPYVKMYESIQVKGDQLLNTELHTIGQQLLNAPQKAKARPWFQQTPLLLLVAAAIVLLFSLIFTLTPTQNASELFAENFKPSLGARGADTLQTPFFEAYNNGDFEKAIAIYQQELADSPAALQPNVNLHLGISYLSDNQIDSALSSLSRVNKDVPAIYDDAQWYMALSYLKVGQLKEAKKRLQLIANDPLQDWSEKASTMLEEF